MSSEPFENSDRPFWRCFDNALKVNKKGADGKQRILSIIAENFSYEELESNLGVC
jgi:hypothetical protein